MVASDRFFGVQHGSLRPDDLLHYEIWKFYQSSIEARANVPQNFILCCQAPGPLPADRPSSSVSLPVIETGVAVGPV